ncbi:MAG: hypothetical protein KKG59_06605 [Nanoarchaeota archaeon]|nr:hypothetical protein [Nanoarchaeota archaeon]
MVAKYIALICLGFLLISCSKSEPVDPCTGYDLANAEKSFNTYSVAVSDHIPDLKALNCVMLHSTESLEQYQNKYSQIESELDAGELKNIYYDEHGIKYHPKIFNIGCIQEPRTSYFSTPAEEPEVTVCTIDYNLLDPDDIPTSDEPYTLNFLAEEGRWKVIIE